MSRWRYDAGSRLGARPQQIVCLRCQMSLLSDAKMYARFGWGLRGFLRQTIAPAEARAIIQRRLAEREANFLLLVEKGIFGYAHSPYRPLLNLAGCELGDVRSLARERGLEGALHELRQAGVYVTFEEFKGREPIVRQGRVFPVKASDFDNPFLKQFYYATSGGSTGAGTRIPTDLDQLAAQTPHALITLEAHGLLDVPRVVWLGSFPDGSGFNNILRLAHGRQIAVKWFSPLVTEALRGAWKHRLATHLAVGSARMHGARLPWPETVPLHQAERVARWVRGVAQSHGACLVSTQVSKALRVCVAAQQAGLDLTGVHFWAGGEPPTPAKVRRITETGARWIAGYWMSEAGLVGQGCARPADENDLHFFRDALALIQHARPVPNADLTVEAFHFTTLLPTASKLMLNVESDDFGEIERRPCGCLLEAHGFGEHLRNVRSFRKLTAEGVTLVGSEMVHILEEVLPSRFGGSPLDYQLVEAEDEQGLTRLDLVVSPRVQLADEAAVLEAVRLALRHSSSAADQAGLVWQQARSMRILRSEPGWTARGKFMPIRPAGIAPRDWHPAKGTHE